jgi:glucose-1-phosphate adenylyltransferase
VQSDNSSLLKTLVLIVPEEGRGLYPLIRNRPQPLVPFGGEFRIIDFTLRNCWNSGFRKVFVLLDYQARIVARHLDSLEWGEDLVCVYPDPCRRYSGTADALFQNLALLRLEAPAYVLVLLTAHIYEMDYAKLLQFHLDHHGEVTIATSGGADIGVYLFNVPVFRKMLLADALAKGNRDLERSVVCRTAGERNIRKFDITSDRSAAFSYWGRVGTVDSYYRTQLNICEQRHNPIGVVSPFVEIAPTARVCNSILLPGVRIGDKTQIRKAIIEEEVRIPDGTIIGFHAEEDRRHFFVSKGGVVVVDRACASRLEGKARNLILTSARGA